MELIFASNNNHKLKEINNIFSEMQCHSHKILSLKDVGLSNLFIDETEDTIEGNAGLKASIVYQLSGIACFADDTGLEIDALGGKPGVYSSRFAGEDCDDAENRRLVLNLMKDTPDSKRTARFKTVIAYINQAEKELFVGICQGKITREEKGMNGFGYDSIFIPDGFNQTFAEMEPELKNRISHRSIAFRNFVQYLLSK